MNSNNSNYMRPNFKPQYENFIGGEWVPPIKGRYFENTSPIDGSVIAQMPRSGSEDIAAAAKAAWQASTAWANTSVTERSNTLMKIADRIEQNLEALAAVETWDNGKAIRETTLADLPLCVDHFRYFGAVIRADSGEINQLDATTTSMEVHEPYGVVGQIIPWNFPLLMAVWKLAPALAAGNCVILKPAEPTPTSINCLMEIIADLLPPGVVNIVHGFGAEAGKALATSDQIKKIAFTGETTTGRLIMQYAAENLIPMTLELGGKSPNIFMPSVCAEDDAFLDKAIEGFVMFALNQGEVCTCPSRALIHESIYDQFMQRALERVQAINLGHPMDMNTMMGAQASKDQHEKITHYIDIGKQEGAEVLTGGKSRTVAGAENGYYFEPTVFRGDNSMRIFQEEIFGPVVSVTTFKDQDEALQIANDSLYGLGSGVWTRDVHEMKALSRGIQAGRVWANCYHLYPAHASFGGYKKSGIGRENHRMMLDHYRQTKNIIMSHDKNALGFF